MRKFLILLGLILSGSSVLAQTHKGLVNKLIEKNILTQDEAQELLDESEKESNKVDLNSIKGLLNRPYMQFGGYGLFTYDYNSQRDIKHNASPRLVVLSIRGTVTKNVDYLVLMDFASPSLLEFNAEWKPIKYFALKAGQFKTPFTLENQYSPTALETVNNTRSLAALAGMGGDPQQLTDSKASNKGGRDLGIQISGEAVDMDSHNLISYAGGLFQGQGINQREVDNHKDFVSSLYFQPIKDLFVGSSVYFGQVKLLGQVDSQVRNRWALSAKYSNDMFDARAEYIKGNGGGFSREGCYCTGVYKMLENKLHLVGKVDYFSKEDEEMIEVAPLDFKWRKIDANVLDYTVGVNYNFYGRSRLMLNYTYSDYNKHWDAKNCSSVLAQMQIVF